MTPRTEADALARELVALARLAIGMLARLDAPSAVVLGIVAARALIATKGGG